VSTRLVADQAALKTAMRAAKDAGVSLSKEELREFQRVVEVPGEIVETAEYKGFEIQVHHLTDVPKFCFTPTILKDGAVVHDIHVRSKDPYVSREHYAKRAIDVFLKTGAWPQKIGIPLR